MTPTREILKTGRRRCWLLLALILSTFSIVWNADSGFSAASDSGSREQQIVDLIEQLGSPQYANREKAESQLRGIGLPAFDWLLEAQHHRDIEVATRARYLLRGLPVAWVDDADTAEVKSILQNYGQQGRDERVTRMGQLARLERSQGIAALCRLARFESDLILSKQAALEVLEHAPEESPVGRLEVAESVKSVLTGSRRPAARWLRAYADTLVKPVESLAAWDQITQDELDVFARTPDETQREVVRDLLRWHVDLLREQQQTEAIPTRVARLVQLVEGDLSELLEFIDWSLEREIWSVPTQLADRFPTEINSHPLLLYRIAEARRKMGQEAAAAQAASRALAMEPEELLRHDELGRNLRMRQMYDWAEAEFRHVLAASKDEPAFSLDARGILAEMLFDLQREKEAAELLEGALAIVKKDPMVFGEFYSEGELESLFNYYYGVHFGRERDREKQKSHFRIAIAKNPANIDIVIAMYRVPEPDSAWQAETTERLGYSLGEVRGRISKLESAVTQSRSPGDRDEVRRDLAQANNELAWLISNTAGDFQEAVRCSLKSLELSPDNWAYQDTLGRCYFAAGDLQQAVTSQKEAVRQAPYLQQMRRQLKQFEDALAAAQNK